MVNFRVGNGTEGKDFEFRPSVNRAFTDTGTTFVLVPKTDYFKFVDVLCKYIRQSGKNMDCLNSGYRNALLLTNCVSVGKDSNLPNVQLFIGQYLYTLPPSFYASFVKSNDDKSMGNTCVLLWDYSSKENDKWLLGTPFLNLFYQVYDMKRNQVGLVPSIYVNNQHTRDLDPVIDTDNGTSKNIIIICGLLSLFLTLPARAILRRKHRHAKTGKDHHYTKITPTFTSPEDNNLT